VSPFRVRLPVYHVLWFYDYPRAPFLPLTFFLAVAPLRDVRGELLTFWIMEEASMTAPGHLPTTWGPFECPFQPRLRVLPGSEITDRLTFFLALPTQL